MSDQNTATPGAQPIIDEPRPSLLSSVLVIAGFITLIAVVLWGLLHIATIASPWVGDLFNNTSTPAIEITAPKEVTSGEDFTLSWKHATDAEGMYALLYQCKNNLRLETSGDSAARVIPCGAAVTVASPEKSIVVKPVLSGSATTSVTISIVFTERSPVIAAATGSAESKPEHAEASIALTVLPRAHVVNPVPLPVVQPVTDLARPSVPAVTALPTQPAPVQPIYTIPSSQPAQYNASTPADLTVNVISLSIDPSGMGVVEFDVANAGGGSSGAYTFEVYLPTQSGYTYVSPTQSPLGPGDRIINTLRFSNAIGGSVSIVVDPKNSVHESNENNNYISRVATQIYGQYPYGY